MVGPFVSVINDEMCSGCKYKFLRIMQEVYQSRTISETAYLSNFEVYTIEKFSFVIGLMA